ncbi:MOSC domain-containing protein [Bacillus sp. CGMCC 1.16607]|uniref:MOSC domain-containing protein n=1 Tax=Bacillus sp. CGMCC 1.16607 TaxID=3351842 RepID=UPI003637E684
MTINKLSIGGIKTYEWKNRMEDSAIGKEVVREALLTYNGFVGDTVANTDFHGGPDRAVCLYPLEHYSQWEREFGHKINSPGFGENISILGMKEDEVFIGDTYEIGDAVIQVSQGRIPCSTISKFNQIDGLLNRVVATGFTGYFFRVLKEGTIKNDDLFKLVDRNEHQVSVLFANQTYFHDRANKMAIEKILKVDELAEVWRNKLTALFLKQNS